MITLVSSGLPKHLQRSLVCAVFITLTFIAERGKARTQEPKPTTSTASGPIWHSRPGPWGELEIRSVYMEAPEGRVDGLKHPSTTTSWHFPDASEASLEALFERAGLAKETQKALLNPNRILLHEQVWTLFPEVAVVAALTQEQRTVIYSELAKSALNPMYDSPAYATGNRVDDWLRQAQLSKLQKEIVRKYLWKDGDLLAFSDVPLLLAQATTEAEVLSVFKFMTRMRALVVHLNISPETRLQNLAAYWTDQGRNLEGLPYLAAEMGTERATSIDITHLLPALPRKLLYTFPTLSSAASGRLPDCQWTAFNFFNTEPREYYLDARLTVTHMREAYEKAEPPYRFGDVLEFVTPGDEAIHACVYVADDIVFTKNGDGLIKPWVLMWLSDVEDLYVHTDNGCKITAYRLKHTAQ